MSETIYLANQTITLLLSSEMFGVGEQIILDACEGMLAFSGYTQRHLGQFPAPVTLRYNGGMDH